uniref:Uncharacterized protein n=1 Tax=Romanomermis culicivorax TaxID=13658 RepID=A0A915KUS5_ROMCU
MTSSSEATMSQSSGIMSSLINPPPIFRKYFNDQDRYISYQKKQHRQDDRFFFADDKIQHKTHDNNRRVRAMVRNGLRQAPQCPARPDIHQKQRIENHVDSTFKTNFYWSV